MSIRIDPLPKIGLVSRLNDVAVVRQSVEERRGHLGVTKHARPLCVRDDAVRAHPEGQDQPRGASIHRQYPR